MSRLELAIKYAWTFMGSFYTWSGDDPAGFDCSGFISEIMQAVGIIGRNERLTAQMFWNRFRNYRVENPCAGCLVFWQAAGNLDKIIHIELCLDDTFSIGASGGGSKTITKEDAIRDNAFVKIRPFRSRLNIRGYSNPFREERI